MSAISDKLISLRQVLGWAGKHIDELMEPIAQTQKTAKTMFQRFFAEMRKKIDDVLYKKTKETEFTNSKNKVTRKQMAEEPPEGGIAENREPKKRLENHIKVIRSNRASSKEIGRCDVEGEKARYRWVLWK